MGTILFVIAEGGVLVSAGVVWVSICAVCGCFLSLGWLVWQTRKRALHYRQLYEMTQEAVQDGIYDIRLQGAGGRYSAVFQRITGASVNEDGKLFESFLSVVHPHDRTEVLNCFEQRTPSAPDFQTRCRLNAGEGGCGRWILLRGSCVKFVDSKPDRFLGTVSDVTAEQVVREDLQYKNAVLHMLINNMPIGLWAKDTRNDNRYFLWNEPMYDYNGIHADDAIGATDDELFNEQVVARQRTTDLAAIQSRRPLKPHIEEVVDVRGGKRFLQVTKLPIIDANSRVSAILGMVLDVTDRIRVVEALRESEAQFKSFLDVTPIGICQTSYRGDDLIYANSAAARMFGYRSVAELKQAGRKQNVAELFYANRGDRRELVQQFVKSGRSWGQFDVKFHRQDGSVFDARLYLCMRDAGQGGQQTFYAFIEDISDQKKTERELLLLRQELEHTARVNTLGQFAASIAHEINQPLTAIMSNAQAALRFLHQPEPDMQEITDILEDIAKDDRRAGDVIARLRLLLKHRQVEVDRVDMNAVIQTVIQLVENDFSGKGIEIKLELAAQLPDVMGDTVQLQQVVLNLLTNGAEAMKDNAPDTRIITVNSGCSQGNVFVQVADTGCGLSPEVEAKIFDPFYTTKKEGLGVGLAINKTIIDNFDGQFYVDSSSEQGAVFKLILPACAMGGQPDPGRPAASRAV